jgi:hypothetical protein
MPSPPPDRVTAAPNATPLDSARVLAERIAGTLRMAQALAAGGRRIDLAGLDRPIGLLCAKSLDLPPDQGRVMRVMLIALLQELDGLSTAMRGLPDGPASQG